MSRMPLTRVQTSFDRCRTAYLDVAEFYDTDTDSSDGTVILEVSEKTIQERLTEAYHLRSLKKVSKILALESPDEQLTAFQALLTSNWHFIKGSLLTYTALPDHTTTHLFIRIAQWVANETGSSVINLLMPTLATESIHPDFPDIIALKSIRRMLRTYILSDDATYPIPAGVLQQYDLCSGPLGRLFNPYFDFSVHPEAYAQLSASEMGRLKSHSAETEALFNLVAEYHGVLTAEDNLLLRLQNLVRLMTANSVNGLGEELLAARGGMIAVSDFFEYYNGLEQKQRKKVPREIRQELAVLLDHATPHPVYNKDGSRQLDKDGKPVSELKNTDIHSCLSLRSGILRPLIKTHATALHQIGLSGTDKIKKCDSLKSQIQHNLDLITRDNYFGSEKLGFTAALLSALDIPFAVTEKNLILLNRLSADEVGIFCEQPHFKNRFFWVVTTSDDLQSILLDWTPQTIRSIFHAIGDWIVKYFDFRTFGMYQFFSILSMLHIDKCRAILEGLSHFPFHFARVASKAELLNILPDDHYRFFCEFHQSRFRDLLRSPQRINSFLFYQRSELSHCQIALTLFQSNLVAHCQSASDLRDMMFCLEDPLLHHVYLALKSHLMSKLDSIGVVFSVLLILRGESKKDFFAEILQGHLHLIGDKNELLEFMRLLPPARCVELAEKLGDRINQFFADKTEKRLFLSELPCEKSDPLRRYFLRITPPAPVIHETPAARRSRSEFFSLPEERPGNPSHTQDPSCRQPR